MKVTNWWKKLAISLVTAGSLSPSLCHAAVIALGDANFETYLTQTTGASGNRRAFATINSAGGPSYAYDYTHGYRAPESGKTASAWVDDPGLNGFNGYYQDSDSPFEASNYLYRAAGKAHPNPHSAVQAMHGYYHYNGQSVSSLFEAGNTYKFSLYAQGNATAGSTGYESFVNNGVWSSALKLYIFDATAPGYDGVATGLNDGSLAQQLYQPAVNGHGEDFHNRGAAGSSATNWTQISLYHYVASGAPEIGHEIGVAFYGRYAANVDDASLEVLPGNVPEPSTIALVAIAGIAPLACWRRRIDEDSGSG